MVVDLEGDRLYWINSGSATIQSMDLRDDRHTVTVVSIHTCAHTQNTSQGGRSKPGYFESRAGNDRRSLVV
jgi:hypothetical protein